MKGVNHGPVSKVVLVLVVVAIVALDIWLFMRWQSGRTVSNNDNNPPSALPALTAEEKAYLGSVARPTSDSSSIPGLTQSEKDILKAKARPVSTGN